ncbi:MAG: carboxy terminal-processing peptidase [Porticoccaceae bacterium]|nr:carboxy terminal-processing peptidase [Porticoccaceae bacterium]
MSHALLAFLLTISVSLSAVAIAPIEKQTEQTALFREILDRLATRHYRGQDINDDLSQRYLSTYIEMLDPLKSYFLQSDIEEFNQWSTKLDDLARRGDVAPGFVMFNRLRDRLLEQLQANIALLESDYEFDYSVDETLVLDPEERQWMLTDSEQRDYWRKRIKDSMIRLLLNDKEPVKARELLVKRFSNQITQMEQRDSQDVFQLYANALASLYDPHTSYFSPRTTENFQINMSLSLEGIGAELRTEDEYTKVARVIPGGPADLQGILKASDKIIAVAQGDEELVDVIGWRIDDVVELIRGAKDSTVRLELIEGGSDSADSTKVIAIVRDKVKLEEKSAQSKIININQNGTDLKLGVIDIPAFYMDFEAYRKRDPEYKSTTRDVYKLLSELREEQVDGIVLDLRNNGGGSLHEATMLTDLFIGTGPVVQIRNAYQQVSRDQRAMMRAAYNGPLLVMINRLSASASEIFAGALQDYGRAVVVGSQSFGKGTVQDVTGLSSGQLKLTVSKFYRVSGDSTQHRGVVPDIEFPSLYDKQEVGESQQDNALPWDNIHSVPFKPLAGVKQFVPLLDAEHKLRISQDPDFLHLVNTLELSNSWDADKAVSLNIEKRRARSSDWDTQRFLLENKRRKLKGLELYADQKAWKNDNKDSDDDATDAESDNKTSDDAGTETEAQDHAKTDTAVAPTSSNDSLVTESKQGTKTEGDEEGLADDENIAETDPMLQEAGYILADQIRLQAKPASKQMIVRAEKVEK